jgi:hypothetical protein
MAGLAMPAKKPGLSRMAFNLRVMSGQPLITCMSQELCHFYYFLSEIDITNGNNGQ